MSWASVATKPAQKPQPTPLRDDSTVDVAVLDANALISGDGLLLLSKLANRAITTPEVLAEVRDKKSRANLDALPFSIETLEPSPDDVKAVLRFARATGDAHALSRADIRLIALARTLEGARHGAVHLREEPAPLTVSSRRPRAPGPKGKLPGWGDTSETWAELERINAEEEAAQEALLAAAKAAGKSGPATNASHTKRDGDAEQPQRSEVDTSQEHYAEAEGSSRIASQLQALVLEEEDGTQKKPASVTDNAKGGLTSPAAQKAKGQAAPKQPEMPLPKQPDVRNETEPDVIPGGDSLPEESAVALKEDASPTVRDDNDDSSWTAGGDVKRLRQKQKKAKEAAEEAAKAERRKEARKRRAAAKAARKVTAAEQQQQQEQEREQEAVREPDAVAEPTSSAAAQEHQKKEGNDPEIERHIDEPNSEEGSPSASFVSSVCIFTGDFAMQNVIVQMGLRLVTKDNQRITRLSRWVLRCSACSIVSKEIGRLFCPRCGNATMTRVRMTVGPDGAEQYGVRTNFNLRGTRFSLPKPKGGRADDVILSEDVLLKRSQQAKRSQPRKTEVDAFSAEFNQDTWHQAAGLRSVSYQGAAALLAGWKNNPNERKHRATNRRRK